MFSTFCNHPEFTLVKEIPRHKKLLSNSQLQTSDTFGFKWSKRETYESEGMDAMTRGWLESKYGLQEQLAKLIEGKTMLDAGCGGGLSALSLFGKHLNKAQYIGIDVSTAVDVAKERFKEHDVEGHFVQCSLDEIPDEIEKFDIIFSEGVLHHTDSTEQAIKCLADRLSPGGTFLFYVYSKKGPIREFTDDFVREKLQSLSNDQAWKLLEPLTKLGLKLGELNQTITLDEPIDLLGIPAGEIDVQRLVYYHVFKCFYHPDLSFDEMNHINFDWYRPLNCHRQTPEEVTRWVEEAGLTVQRIVIEESGITVVAKKM